MLIYVCPVSIIQTSGDDQAIPVGGVTHADRGDDGASHSIEEEEGSGEDEGVDGYSEDVDAEGEDEDEDVEKEDGGEGMQGEDGDEGTQ